MVQYVVMCTVNGVANCPFCIYKNKYNSLQQFYHRRARALSRVKLLSPEFYLGRKTSKENGSL